MPHAEVSLRKMMNKNLLNTGSLTKEHWYKCITSKQMRRPEENAQPAHRPTEKPDSVKR